MSADDGDEGATELLAVSPEIDSRGGRVTAERIEGGVRFGYAAPLVDGRPIPPNSELCEMRQRDDGVWLRRPLGSGPSKVNSRAYRENWTSIFGKQQVGEA